MDRNEHCMDVESLANELVEDDVLCVRYPEDKVGEGLLPLIVHPGSPLSDETKDTIENLTRIHVGEREYDTFVEVDFTGVSALGSRALYVHPKVAQEGEFTFSETTVEDGVTQLLEAQEQHA